jgi:hypothetical protein
MSFYFCRMESSLEGTDFAEAQQAVQTKGLTSQTVSAPASHTDANPQLVTAASTEVTAGWCCMLCCVVMCCAISSNAQQLVAR